MRYEYAESVPNMTDYGDEGQKIPNFKALDDLKPAVAVAVKDADGKTPTVMAAGRGALAEQILQIAFDNDIKVREDADLANILAELELDSPIPTEALMAVAEILSYVYRANGEPDPFNAILGIESENDDGL